MADKTAISWVDRTYNPWTGCDKVSAGCAFCYAERESGRYDNAQLFGKDAPRQFRAESYWLQLPKWDKAAYEEGRRHTVFVMSMGDLFEDRPDLVEHRARLLALVGQCQNLDFLMLTKRPENIGRLCTDAGYDWEVNGFPDNVWLMTSVESNQDAVTDRVQALLSYKAKVYGLSCEPLLELPRLDQVRIGNDDRTGCADDCCLLALSWIITGGESSKEPERCRPMDPDAARQIRAWCREYKIAEHFKQWGNWLPGFAMGRQHCRRLGFAKSSLITESDAQADQAKVFHWQNFKVNGALDGDDTKEWPATALPRDYVVKPEGYALKGTKAQKAPETKDTAQGELF